MWQRFRLLYQRVRSVKRWCDGDEEYARYRERAAGLRQSPLDRGRYFARRLEERYRTASRCC
jgi:hypothetical protein